LLKLNTDQAQTPIKRVFREVDKSVNLRAELRALQGDNHDHRERELELRRENRRLKVQMDQEKAAFEDWMQEQERGVTEFKRQMKEQEVEVTKFKASLTAQLNNQLQEYCTQMERENKELTEGFAQELARAKVRRHRMCSQSST
jgi:hypothetical protein